jgi:hypothetical protein
MAERVVERSPREDCQLGMYESVWGGAGGLCGDGAEEERGTLLLPWQGGTKDKREGLD